MRRPIRNLVLVGASVALVASACSKPYRPSAAKLSPGQSNNPVVGNPVSASTAPPTTAAAAAKTATNSGGSAGATSGATSGGNTAAGRVSTAGGNTTAATTPGEQLSQVDAVGAKVYPQSTTRGPLPYYLGVGNKTITLDFSIDQNSCGVNVTNALTAAGGALPTTTRYYQAAPTQQSQIVAAEDATIRDLVKYFNDDAFQAAAPYPHIRPLMGNDPANPYFGRHLVANIINGGSNQCPDVTKAAAVQAAQQDHAFAVLNNYDGAQYNMAEDLHSEPANARPMHFGTLWLSDSTYNQLAPYAWTQFSTGTTIVRQLASYVCSKLVGRKASHSSQYSGSVRKFGLVHTNLPQDEQVISDFKYYLAQYCHGQNPIAVEVAYDGTDFTNAQKDDTNLIVQLHAAGVTSVLMLGDPVQGLFQEDDASAQNYYPEWIWTSIGYGDSSTVQRLWNQTEAAGDFGTSNLGVLGGFGIGGGDAFEAWHYEHRVAPDGKPCDPSSEAGMDHGGDPNTGAAAMYCKAPFYMATEYYVALPLVGGILYAGPNLTPQNVSKGLQSFPETRYGAHGPTTDPRPALVGAGPGKYGFVVDSVEWAWNPNETSPAPESKKGWVMYPDCQRHYITWPNQLAPDWLPNEPAYNAWCGAPGTDYPKTEPSDTQ